jgi:hypothetical protein
MMTVLIDRSEPLLCQIEELRLVNKRLVHTNLEMDQRIYYHSVDIRQLQQAHEMAANELRAEIAALQAQVHLHQQEVAYFQAQSQEYLQIIVKWQERFEVYRYRLADRLVGAMGRVPGLKRGIRKAIHLAGKVGRLSRRILLRSPRP